MAAFGAFILFYFLLQRKKLLKNLIEEVHYGLEQGKFKIFRISRHMLLFKSLYEMGFLFTLAFITLPSLVFRKTTKSFQRLSYYAMSFAAISASAGLIISLKGERLSTMPTQILLLVVVLIAPKLISTFQVISSERSS